ncbi:hypothetical protein RCS94_03550 [Orbaceae bacterium ac157xtp]
MIKVITFLITFFKSNKSKILLIISFVSLVIGAFMFGLHEGKTQTEIKYANQKIKQSTDALSHFVETTKQLVNDANSASNSLAKQLVERKNNDEQSTQILIKLLDSQSNQRSDCVFDDDIMRIINQARNRAITSTTGGIASDSINTLRNPSGNAK